MLVSQQSVCSIAEWHKTCENNEVPSARPITSLLGTAPGHVRDSHRIRD